MQTCKKCGNGFEPSKGLIKYCSLECRNSRVFTEEANKKKSEKQKNFWRFLEPEQRDALIAKRSRYHTEESLAKLRETFRRKLLEKGFENCGRDARRKLVIFEQKEQCNRCGLAEWLGQKLSLEIDHKDGNSENNSRENLEALCPNCHSLTPTWRGRNRPSSNGELKVSDEELKEYLRINKNIRQALLAAGLAAKGNNYNRAKLLLAEMNMGP